MSDKDYRKIRGDLLTDYCVIAKTDFPGVKQIIGVAHESSDEENSSEDFLYYNATEWTDVDQKNAVELKKEYQSKGLLGERKFIKTTYLGKFTKMKGRDRNNPCPCGSGKKYKRCCGLDGDV